MIARIIRYRAPVILLVSCIAIFGVMTYRDLPRESFPDIDIPTVMVSTPYIGVAPEDIESLVTIPLENELAGLSDLKKMTSTSAEGVSLVVLEFEPDVVIEDKLQRVRDRVSRARSKLPSDVEDTDVQEISFDQFPIMIVAISGPTDEEKLKALGEDLEDELKRIPGVLDAKLSGGREREIRIAVDPIRLAHYKLSLDDIVGAVANENVNIPGGDVTAGQANFLVRVPGDFQAAKDIEGVAIKRIGDRPVFVRDVATVIDGFQDRTSYARVNGDSAVTVAVMKRTGANILEVAKEAKSLVARHAEGWPKGVTWRVVGDQSRDIEMMVSDLENNIITSLLLIVVVLFFFFGARNSLFVAATLPLSFLLTLLVLSAWGITLNMVVLFSLVFGLGMVVDNGIVLVENIYRHLESGMGLVEASVRGAREVAVPLLGSTATTSAAFIPLLFWTGIMGEFMGYLPKTVIVVLLSSLLVAIGFVPVFTARWMRGPAAKATDAKASTAAPVRPFHEKPFMQRYRRVLEWCIDHRYKTVGIAVVVLVGTFMIYGVFNHGTEFFPEVEPDRAIVSVRGPDGMDLDATDTIVRQVEQALSGEKNVSFYVAETGIAGGADPLAGAQAVPSQARVTVDFLPHPTRTDDGDTPRFESTTVTIERVRAELEKITGAEITIEKEAQGPPVGKAVSVEVRGESFHDIGAAAARIRRELAALPGVTNVSDNYRVGRPELRLRIDRGAAKRVGASTKAIAGTVRTAVNGTKASVLRVGENEYDITVELAPEYRSDLQSVMALRIPGREDTSPDTFSVPLSTVAAYELAGGSGSIRHVDQDLVVTVGADVVGGFNENAVQGTVSRYLTQVELPEGIDARLAGAQDEQRQSEAFLGKAFLIALFLITIALVGEFNRFDVPIVIMLAVIMSLIGVLWGLMITNTPFGVIMTGIGVISLAGIVVNNAIVLLDYIEQQREEGHPVRVALVNAGLTRFRPVTLSALTNMLGLIPTALGISFDFLEWKLIVGGQSAEWWGPMAIAVVFGLVFATALTLLLLPTLYAILEDLRTRPAFAVMAKQLVRSRRPRGSRAAAEAVQE